MRKILLLGAAVALAGCTTAQRERVNTTLNTICTSAPLAQALYNSAVASGNQSRVNEILNYLQAMCPTVLILVQTIPVREQLPPAPPPPTPGPERG